MVPPADAAGWAQRRPLWREVQARMAGPGGLYNLGDLLGLAMSLAHPFAAASDQGGRGVEASVAAARGHLLGTPAATAPSVAALVFLWSGEFYHRAWSLEAAARGRLIRRADLVSGLGAIVLSIALLLVGEPLPAAASGVLPAGGKLGTALADPSTGLGCRLVARAGALWGAALAALLSRAPEPLSVLVELRAVPTGEGAPAAASVIAPLTLPVCYALWA